MIFSKWISNVKGRNLTCFLTSGKTMSGQGLGTSKSLRWAIHWTTYKTNLAMYELRAIDSKELIVIQTKTISRKEKNSLKVILFFQANLAHHFPNKIVTCPNPNLTTRNTKTYS
jgi:hypothetical protein